MDCNAGGLCDTEFPATYKLTKPGVLLMNLPIFLYSILLSLTATAGEAGLPVRFAFENNELGGTDRGIYLQAESGTDDLMMRVCGLTGQRCSCEFLDSAGRVVGASKGNEIRYEAVGNYFRCSINGTIRGAVSARLVERKPKGRRSAIVQIRDHVSLGDIIGRELDFNRLRYIYRYNCEQTYLQKEGTTSWSFDCSRQFASCDPSGNPRNNFCLLNANFPYYLYSDSYSTNFGQKIADEFYNGDGSGRVCGLQIRKYNCAGEQGYPVKNFGVYGQMIGYWRVAVSLQPAPDAAVSVFGYAGRVSPVTNECPPWLEKREFQRADIVTSDIYPSHNFPSQMTSTLVGSSSVSPQEVEIYKYSGGMGGFCNGEYCSLPNSFAGTVKSHRYASVEGTSFCVIPASMLP